MPAGYTSKSIEEDPYNPGTYYMAMLYNPTRQFRFNQRNGVWDRHRVVLLKSTDGYNWDFVCDIDRWGDVSDTNMGDLMQNQNMYISVSEDYIYIQFSRSEAYSTDSHNEGFGVVHILEKDKLPEVDGKGLPAEYVIPDKAIVAIEGIAADKYTANSAFNCQVKAYYYDGTSALLNMEDVYVTEPDMSVAGEQKVIVDYKGFRDVFTINVVAEDAPVIPEVEVVKPDTGVTVTPSEDATITEDEQQTVIDSLIPESGSVAQPDPGFTAEGNETVVDSFKDSVVDSEGNAVTETVNDYVPSLKITLNTVVMDKNGSTVTAKKVTYDVTPLLYAMGADGTVLGQTEMNDFAVELTFRLPVDKNTAAEYARVWHEDEELEQHRIHTDGNGNKYVEVRSKSFSAYSVEPIEEEQTDPITVNNSYFAHLTLESVVYLNISFSLDNLGEIDPADLTGRVGVLVWDQSAAMTEDTAIWANRDKVYSNVTWNEEDQCYEIRTEGIPAKNLGDTLQLRAYYVREDGTYVYGRFISYSPKQYCYQMKDDAQMGSLAVALLNYGAAAQKLFNHNTDALMNADLTEEQQQIVWDGSLVSSDWDVPTEKMGALTRDEQITSRGLYLSLEGNIEYNHYVAVDAGVTVEDAEILVWTEASYNGAEILTEENAQKYDMVWNAGESIYEYKHPGMAAKEMFKRVYFCAKITDTEGNTYYGGVVAVNPERYAYMNQNNAEDPALAELSKAMVIYGDAARSYFGNNA